MTKTLAMKMVLSLVLVLIFACGLAAADSKTERMIAKADEILSQTEVVSNRAVGFAGECPEANWALSLIITRHPEPVAHLLVLSEHCHPAGFVMCFLGVRTLDEKRFITELKKREKDISEAKWKIETAVGCSFGQESALEILTAKGAWRKDQIICDSLPELWETIRLFPQLESLQKEANHSTEPAPGAVH
jgi:hypothetical protein